MEKKLSSFLEWLERARSYDIVLFHFGKNAFTLWQMAALALGITLLLVLSRWLRSWVANRLLARSNLDLSMRYTVASLLRYVVLVAGFMAIMQTVGIDLTTFNVVAGAVGVGLGFGLQNIVSNFISGLIVMFERPVRIGDRIEMAGIEGDVLEIGARATRIVTAEGAVVIMPNQKFITDPVRNWVDHQDRTALVLTLNVDRSGDPRAVQELLRDTLAAQPEVLKEPEPQVWMTGLTGSNAFRLHAWVKGNAAVRGAILNRLYMAVYEALTKREIKLA